MAASSGGTAGGASWKGLGESVPCRVACVLAAHGRLASHSTRRRFASAIRQHGGCGDGAAGGPTGPPASGCAQFQQCAWMLGPRRVRRGHVSAGRPAAHRATGRRGIGRLRSASRAAQHAAFHCTREGHVAPKRAAWRFHLDRSPVRAGGHSSDDLGTRCHFESSRGAVKSDAGRTGQIDPQNPDAGPQFAGRRHDIVAQRDLAGAAARMDQYCGGATAQQAAPLEEPGRTGTFWAHRSNRTSGHAPRLQANH
jgi:hypothetical protein